jgi:hypothetical protein
MFRNVQLLYFIFERITHKCTTSIVSDYNNKNGSSPSMDILFTTHFIYIQLHASNILLDYTFHLQLHSSNILLDYTFHYNYIQVIFHLATPAQLL